MTPPPSSGKGGSPLSIEGPLPSGPAPFPSMVKYDTISLLFRVQRLLFSFQDKQRAYVASFSQHKIFPPYSSS